MQGDEVRDSRERFIGICSAYDNGNYKNHDKYKITCKENKQHRGGPPFSRPTYEVVDYLMAPNRWTMQYRI